MRRLWMVDSTPGDAYGPPTCIRRAIDRVPSACVPGTSASPRVSRTGSFVLEPIAFERMETETEDR